MASKREQIIQRVFEIVNGIDDLKFIARNVREFDDTQLPGAGVIEGDEVVQDDEVSGRPSAKPYLVIATPQVFVRAKATGDVGTDLNLLTARIQKAVTSDPELNNLSFKGSGIRYAGLNSLLHSGRSMVGAYALLFQIKYLLIPTDL